MRKNEAKAGNDNSALKITRYEEPAYAHGYITGPFEELADETQRVRFDKGGWPERKKLPSLV